MSATEQLATPPPPPEPGTRLDVDRREASGPASSIRRLLSSPLGIVVLFVGGVLIVDAGGTDDGPGLCIFRRCTGGYCPGCGVTRASRHLTRGEFAAAWKDHPWVLFAAAQAIVLAGAWGVARVTARRIAWARLLRVVAVANTLALVGIWIIRLVNESIPRFF